MPNPFARVAKVKIHGQINQRMAHNIFKRLTVASFLPIRGVVVQINSVGGSLTQAKNISDMLINFSKQKNAPVYCFAQDECLGAANVILTTGYKSYANPMSVMGGFGFSWQILNFHKLTQKYNIKQQQISINSTNLGYKHFEQLKPETAQFTRMQLQSLSKDLIQKVGENRKAQIKKANRQLKQLSEQIWSKPAVVPEMLIKHGIIDGIRDAWQTCHEEFNDMKWFIINRDEVYDFIRYGFNDDMEHSYLQNYNILNQSQGHRLK